jgi:hypothetical protein
MSARPRASPKQKGTARAVPFKIHRRREWIDGFVWNETERAKRARRARLMDGPSNHRPSGRWLESPRLATAP